jgi:hypothetical protein
MFSSGKSIFSMLQNVRSLHFAHAARAPTTSSLARAPLDLFNATTPMPRHLHCVSTALQSDADMTRAEKHRRIGKGVKIEKV